MVMGGLAGAFMTSYIDDTLTTGETVLLRGRVSLSKYWLNFVLSGILLVAAVPMIAMALSSSEPPVMISMDVIYIILAILLLLPPIIRRTTNELALTNKRAIAKFGLISLETVEINLDKIEGIRVKQGLFGKMLNYGTVTVQGTGGTHAIIPNISNPVEFRRQFGRAQETLKAA
jgi:uncharacterized membrane protein YdbT with pleckstrin-like domain